MDRCVGWLGQPTTSSWLERLLLIVYGEVTAGVDLIESTRRHRRNGRTIRMKISEPECS